MNRSTLLRLMATGAALSMIILTGAGYPGSGGEIRVETPDTPAGLAIADQLRDAAHRQTLLRGNGSGLAVSARPDPFDDPERGLAHTWRLSIGSARPGSDVLVSALMRALTAERDRPVGDWRDLLAADSLSSTTVTLRFAAPVPDPTPRLALTDLPALHGLPRSPLPAAPPRGWRVSRFDVRVVPDPPAVDSGMVRIVPEATPRGGPDVRTRPMVVLYRFRPVRAPADAGEATAWLHRALRPDRFAPLFDPASRDDPDGWDPHVARVQALAAADRESAETVAEPAAPPSLVETGVVLLAPDGAIPRQLVARAAALLEDAGVSAEHGSDVAPEGAALVLSLEIVPMLAADPINLAHLADWGIDDARARGVWTVLARRWRVEYGPGIHGTLREPRSMWVSP